MNKTWMTKFAGITDIVVGGLGTVCSLYSLMYTLVIHGGREWSYEEPITLMFAIPLLVFGILAMVGGVYALKRARWGWALTGTIATFLLLFPLGVAGMVLEIPIPLSYLVVLPGIAAIVFTIITRNTFQ